MKLTEVYRVFHPAIGQYTFFSATHGSFSKTDDILDQKTSLNKYMKVEIKPCILSGHDAIKLELNNKRNHKNIQISRLKHIAS
jgi:hypothetical protein